MENSRVVLPVLWTHTIALKSVEKEMLGGCLDGSRSQLNELGTCIGCSNLGDAFAAAAALRRVGGTAAPPVRRDLGGQQMKVASDAPIQLFQEAGHKYNANTGRLQARDAASLEELMQAGLSVCRTVLHNLHTSPSLAIPRISHPSCLSN